MIQWLTQTGLYNRNKWQFCHNKREKIMTPDVAQAILQFLQNVEIKGNQAETLFVCQQALIKIAQTPAAVPPMEAGLVEEA
jgi:hypothetical protein